MSRPCSAHQGASSAPRAGRSARERRLQRVDGGGSSRSARAGPRRSGDGAGPDLALLDQAAILPPPRSPRPARRAVRPVELVESILSTPRRRREASHSWRIESGAQTAHRITEYVRSDQEGRTGEDVRPLRGGIPAIARPTISSNGRVRRPPRCRSSSRPALTAMAQRTHRVASSCAPQVYFTRRPDRQLPAPTTLMSYPSGRAVVSPWCHGALLEFCG